MSSHCEASFRRDEDISQSCVWEELQPGWPGCGQERGTKSSNKATRSTTWSPTRLGSPSPDGHTPPHIQGEHDAWANDEELMLQL